MVKELKEKKAPAKMWKRAGAYILDILILQIVVVFPFKKNLKGITIENTDISYLQNLINNNPDIITSILLVSLSILMLSILYFSALEFYTRQSLGKMLFQIRVMSKTKDLKFWQCLIRNISKPTTLLLFIDVLYLIFKHQNQRYLEKISNTIVVEEVMLP